MSPTNSEFIAEVLRINDRYLTELVEGHDVCPFARGARTGRAVTQRVLLDETPDPASGLAAISELEAEEGLAVALLIYPRLGLPPEGFERFVSELRARDQARRPPPFAMAMFHPDGDYGAESPRRLVMFFRRAPDPTIQLVRFSVLDAVKGNSPIDGKYLFEFSAQGLAELERRAKEVSVSEQIARDNFATAGREGIPRLQAILDDIRADRDRSYARFEKR